MLKKFLLVAALGTSACAANAQSSLGSHLSLGPVLSFGNSWVSNIPDRDFKFAPALGVGLVYSRNVHWGLGAQLLVSHEGYKREIAGPGNSITDVSINPVYLRMPLQATYFFGNFGDRVRPKIYAGPSMAVRVDERHFYTNDDAKIVEGGSTEADQFSRFDFGLTAGVGANIRVGSALWLNLDGGYYQGLVDVIPSTSEFNGNRNLRFNVGLMWGL